MVPSEEPELSLLDLDKSEGQTVDRNFIRNWKVARDELVRRVSLLSSDDCKGFEFLTLLSKTALVGRVLPYHTAQQH